MGWFKVGQVIGKKAVEYVVPKVAKNLTERRKTFESMTGAVDKQYKTAGVKITSEGQKIKKKAVLEGSKIHDKYEKLEKILKKK